MVKLSDEAKCKNFPAFLVFFLSKISGAEMGAIGEPCYTDICSEMVSVTIALHCNYMIGLFLNSQKMNLLKGQTLVIRLLLM